MVITCKSRLSCRKLTLIKREIVARKRTRIGGSTTKEIPAQMPDDEGEQDWSDEEPDADPERVEPPETPRKGEASSRESEIVY